MDREIFFIYISCLCCLETLNCMNHITAPSQISTKPDQVLLTHLYFYPVHRIKTYVKLLNSTDKYDCILNNLWKVKIVLFRCWKSLKHLFSKRKLVSLHGQSCEPLQNNIFELKADYLADRTVSPDLTISLGASCCRCTYRSSPSSVECCWPPRRSFPSTFQD